MPKTDPSKVTAEIVPMAEVRRLAKIADELRQVADDAQGHADEARGRANQARHKADSARTKQLAGPVRRSKEVRVKSRRKTNT